MNHSAAILICTKNRPGYLENTLNRILAARLTNVNQILVADGSDNGLTRILCERLTLQSKFLAINWIPIDGGKPSALNQGFNRLQAFGVIHCVDDDITIPVDYFTTVEDFLMEHLDIVGVAPLIRNRTSSSQYIENHKNAGLVTRYGVNYWFNELQNLPAFEYSDWLPGGACSYRTSALRHVTSSSLLHNTDVNYALGDDVDLSIQVSNAGKLACITSLEVMHEEAASLSSSNRIHELDVARAKWKIYLWRNYPGRFSMLQILSWDLFSGIYHILLRDQLMTSARLFTYFRAFGKEAWSLRKNTGNTTSER